MHTMSAEMQKCIEHCQNCHAVCLGMASTHCLELGGRHVEPEHFRLMLSCAEICRASAAMMLIGHHLHKLSCAACAEICEACAVSCDQVGDMGKCVLACRDCAAACRSMANGD